MCYVSVVRNSFYPRGREAQKVTVDTVLYCGNGCIRQIQKQGELAKVMLLFRRYSVKRERCLSCGSDVVSHRKEKTASVTKEHKSRLLILHANAGRWRGLYRMYNLRESQRLLSGT